MRIIITGAGGFLGHELLKQASDKRMEIIAFTSGPERLKNEYSMYEKITVLDKDYIFFKRFNFFDTDVLVNCAFPRTEDGRLMADGLSYIQEFLLIAYDYGVRNIINISSQSVYDPKRTVAARESDPVILKSVYSVGKYTSELLCKMIKENANVTNIRMASLIGPGFEQRVTNKMAKKAIENREISYLSNDVRFGFLDVTDATRAILKLALLPPEKWKPIYNLGSMNSYSLKQIAVSIADILYKQYGISISIIEKKSSESGESSLCSDLLVADVGMYQELSLQDSLNRIIEMIMLQKN